MGSSESSGFTMWRSPGSTRAVRPLHPPTATRPDNGEDDAADDEPRALHHVRVDHSAQAALHRVDGREDGQADHDRQLVPTEQQDAEERARPKVDGVLGKHVHHQQIAGEEGAQAPSEAALEEFGDGVDPAAQIERRKQRGENDEAPRGHPFEPAGDEADTVAVARHADHVFGRDIGGEQRHADKRPPQVAPGQEVLGVRLLLARRTQNCSDNERQTDDDDDRNRECLSRAKRCLLALVRGPPNSIRSTGRAVWKFAGNTVRCQRWAILRLHVGREQTRQLFLFEGHRPLLRRRRGGGGFRGRPCSSGRLCSAPGRF